MRRKLTYDPARDCYTLLGLDSQATREDIRQAYRRCVREVHPDLNPDRAEWATEQLQRINEAYTVLSDPALRADYDRLRWPFIAPRPAPGSSAPVTAPPFDYGRPWWDQMPAPTLHSDPFAGNAQISVDRAARRDQRAAADDGVECHTSLVIRDS